MAALYVPRPVFNIVPGGTRRSTRQGINNDTVNSSKLVLAVSHGASEGGAVPDWDAYRTCAETYGSAQI